VGTAAGLGPTALGAVVVVESALAEDGASRALGASGRVDADARLAASLHGDVRGLVVSLDVHDPARAQEWAEQRALAADLATAAVFAAAARAGIAAAAVLGVTRAAGQELGEAETEALESALGAAAAAALR
jgi:uridine phosphorylase